MLLVHFLGDYGIAAFGRGGLGDVSNERYCGIANTGGYGSASRRRGSAHAISIEFWYGNIGSVEIAIKAQCDAFNAAQSEHKIICVGQDSYEVLM